MEGVFNSRIIKKINTYNREIQYGPLSTPKIEDPLDKLAKATMGSFPYEANGVVEWRPDTIQFLGS